MTVVTSVGTFFVHIHCSEQWQVNGTFLALATGAVGTKFFSTRLERN